MRQGGEGEVDLAEKGGGRRWWWYTRSVGVGLRAGATGGRDRRHDDMAARWHRSQTHGRLNVGMKQINDAMASIVMFL